jgi:hypothetical protein
MRQIVPRACRAVQDPADAVTGPAVRSVRPVTPRCRRDGRPAMVLYRPRLPARGWPPLASASRWPMPPALSAAQVLAGQRANTPGVYLRRTCAGP